MNRILVLFITFCLSVLSYGQNAETLREARAGNAAAQYRMAQTYLYGMYGAEKNDEKYIYWLKKSANNGYAKAQYDIAKTYLNGMYGAEKNDEKYVYWLKKSANNGYAEAQYNLGELYCYGKHGVYKDKSEYLRWAKKAAYNGYTSACYSLGDHYENIDKQEAIYWLKKGMDLWWKEYKEENEIYAYALRKLGVHYHPGDKSTYSTSSNSSHSTNPSSNSSNSSSGHQQRQVWKERWRNCTACDPDRRGYCRNCHGRGGYYIGNYYNVCGICGGTGSCTMCGGRGEYKETYSTWE